MVTNHLTNSEQRVIDTLRQMFKDSRGKPFQMTISHPGGNAPIQVYRAVPVRDSTPILDNGNGKDYTT